ncbi:MAG: hypothetical protein GKS00_27265 [Alphaproteobacteria bacterium]|nr:hypothetical protein [Alphaproteobacteria bacterium]
MIIWEKYVKKYVWDDDKTPYFIPVSKLMRDQADKEIFLYCFFLAIPAALINAVFVSELYKGDFGNLALGLYGTSILACVVYLKIRKSTYSALFAISAPIVLLLHFAVNGFDVPNLNINTAEVVSADTNSDRLTLAAEKRWTSGHRMMLTTDGRLPAPLSSNTVYYLIGESGKSYQLAATVEDARGGVAIDLTYAGSGFHTLQRIIQLHLIEKIGMIVIVLLWLRYTLRVVAITKAYPNLPVRDMNPWSKLPPGTSPPRK